MKQDKTVLGVTFSKLIGFMFFLVFLSILNYFGCCMLITDFLYNNLDLIIMFSILFYLGELFYIFIFPFNIPYPIFNAFGGVLLVKFLFMLITMFVDFGLKYIEPYVSAIVFVIVIIVGYVKIVVDLISDNDEKEQAKHHKKKEPEWEDVGNEFKLALYNLASYIKENLEPDKKKKK